MVLGLARALALAVCLASAASGCTTTASAPTESGSIGGGGSAGSAGASGGTGNASATGGVSSGGNASGGSAGTAGQAPIADVSADLEPIRAKNALPALAGAVWNGGTLIAAGVTGVRKQGDATPATLDDQWHLGSCTKAMTATLIGEYVDVDAIHFEDTIAMLFAGETIAPGYVNVTLLDLLQHRGGAPEGFPEPIGTQMWIDGSSADARAKAAIALIALPPENAHGTFKYSNAGYLIAGAALERATGYTWEDMMKTDLFGALGMSSCGFGPPGTPGQIDQPWGHGALSPGDPSIAYDPGDPLADNPPAMGPAGTVHCSLVDWGKFLALHLAGARGEPTILTPATIKILHTPNAGSGEVYAAGWMLTERDWAGGLTLFHSGSNLLWMVTTWLAPATNRVFAVVTNDGDDAAINAVDEAFSPLIQKYGN